MFNVIVVTDNSYGIGINNTLPWSFKEDMKLFKHFTSNDILEPPVVIMGRKTLESLPNNFLPNRHNIVITRSKLDDLNNKLKLNIKKHKIDTVNDFSQALTIANKYSKNNIWVIGGADIYKMACLNENINHIYLTQIDSTFDCDTYIKLPPIKNIIYEKTFVDKNRINTNIYNLKFTIYEPELTAEQQYLRLINEIILNGNKRETRNATVISLFGKELNFNVTNKFPLLTTKKMFLRGIVEELLFFIRGETDTIKLSEKGIRIWEGNTSVEFLNQMKEKNDIFKNYKVGDMGPMYGYQWRNYGKLYYNSIYNQCCKCNDDKSIDQLQNLIKDIKSNPHSRRLLMTDYNPLQVNEGVLFPCHSLILQFYVENEYLSVKMYQRSADIFLGLPFNIASTTILLYIIAQLTGYTPKDVNITLGDCHIYCDHLNQVERQLKRNPYEEPHFKIPQFKNLEDVENSQWSDFELLNYNCHPGIKAQMIA
jgi:dihydrofolate reductase/thymidylate synthase